MSALLLTLLLAPPERVVVVARKPEPPGFFEQVGRPLLRAFERLYQREDDDVARGNALAAQDDPEGALREYDKARAREPDDPRIAYDRASVLLKMDAKAAPVAAAEASQALQNGDSALKPKAAYQLALATEAMGHADDAIRQYGAALALDPDDVDSKVNLELLLRTPKEKRAAPAGQPKEEKPAQQKADQKPQPQQGEAAKQQQESQPSDPKSAQRPEEQPEQQQAQKQQAQQKQQSAQEKPLDRTEAQRLLDALRASEKQLQTWRFAKKKTDLRKRSDPEKDW